MPGILVQSPVLERRGEEEGEREGEDKEEDKGNEEKRGREKRPAPGWFA